MKKKTVQELKNKEIKELRLDVGKARDGLLKLQLDHTQFKLKNPRSLATKRREIAVLLTIIREKEAHDKNA